LDENNYDKILVFWDSATNSSQRKLIYSEYKENRKKIIDNDLITSFTFQKNRIKEYLEEMFIRQLEVDNCEADDLIAYYCSISPNESKTIFSADKDLTQLINTDVSVYSPNKKTLYRYGDKIPLDNFEFPHVNIKVIKILIGDKSDNIYGIKSLGEKTLVKIIPEILENKVSIDDILKKGNELLTNTKKNVIAENLINGVTKNGVLGEKFYEINDKLINLTNPLISEEGKTLVHQYYNESLDPDGRGYKNLMRMMMSDGLFKYLPKDDNGWIFFLKPFLKLSRKEKTNFKNKNK
jgi:5'-3' exonuclease